MLRVYLFSIVDDGKAPYTHHQPTDNTAKCVLLAEPGSSCFLVVQATTSSTAKPLTDKGNLPAKSNP